MANFLYVDNSCVWIEGMHVAAVHAGQARSVAEAQDKKISDRSYKIDFGRLLQFAGGDKTEIGRAVLYGSRPPPNDSVWLAAKAQGFEPVVHDRSMWHGGEKKVDVNIATDIITDSFERMKPASDEVTLVTGDSDFVPTVEALRKRKFRVDVCFWEHAARELKDAASSFISLNPYFEHLRLK